MAQMSKRQARREFEREMAEAVRLARNNVLDVMSKSALTLGAPVRLDTFVGSFERAWLEAVAEVAGPRD